MEKFDYTVIGAGPGGYVSAIRASQLGLKTALIEKQTRLGGTCLNIGCIPSKALLESSELFYSAKNKLHEHGINIKDVGFNLDAMMSRKTKIVETLTDGVNTLMLKNKIKVIKGLGSLGDKCTIIIEKDKKKELIESDKIVLAMGSLPVELPFMKFDHEHVIDSTDALELKAVPEKLIIIGAGAIGLELGSVWSRLGSKVSIIEMLPQIAPFADKIMSTMLQRSLVKQGIDFFLKAKVTGATVKGAEIEVTYIMNGNELTVTGNKVLVAVGRRPNTLTAGLTNSGIKFNDSGFVSVDEKWESNLDNVFAIGDLKEGPMLAHKAAEEGIAVAEICAGKPGHVNYDAIPNVVYTWPELATVGITEETAKQEKIDFKVGKFFFRGNGRALSLGETDGLVKIIAEKETDQVLGVQILGPRASDMIAEAVLGLEFKATAEDFARTTHAHPSLSEVLKEAAMAVDKRQIHG